MNSGNSDMVLLRHAETFGFLDVEAGCVLLDAQPSTVVKALARLTALGKLVKTPYLHPRCYWHPRKPLGAQGLIYAASLSFRCVLAESRTWSPIERQGPATLIDSGSEREALFIDYGAAPRSNGRKLGSFEAEATQALVVPSAVKAQAVARYIPDVRFIVFPDLWRLQCQSPKGPPRE